MAVTPRIILRRSARGIAPGRLARAAEAVRSVTGWSRAALRELAQRGQLGTDYEQRIGRHTGARC